MTVTHAIEHHGEMTDGPGGWAASGQPSGSAEPHTSDAHAHAPEGEGAGGPLAGRYVVPAPNAFTRFFLKLYARSPKWAAPAAVAACFGGVASLVLVSNPTDGGASAVSTCIIKMTTGLDCPGCGGTRAFYFLMQGNVPEAARHHVLAVFAAPFLVWIYLAWAVRQVSGRRLPMPRVTPKAVSVFLAAWFVFMILRNLPFAPFTSLYV